MTPREYKTLRDFANNEIKKRISSGQLHSDDNYGSHRQDYIERNYFYVEPTKDGGLEIDLNLAGMPDILIKNYDEKDVVKKERIRRDMGHQYPHWQWVNRWELKGELWKFADPRLVKIWEKAVEGKLGKSTRVKDEAGRIFWKIVATNDDLAGLKLGLGKKDKYGVEMFEGDTVKVSYCDGKQFLKHTIEKDDRYPRLYMSDSYHNIYEFRSDRFEVITLNLEDNQ